jgi:hypothetical protein
MSVLGTGITAASSISPAKPVFSSKSFNSLDPSLIDQPKIFTCFVNLYSFLAIITSLLHKFHSYYNNKHSIKYI